MSAKAGGPVYKAGEDPGSGAALVLGFDLRFPVRPDLVLMFFSFNSSEHAELDGFSTNGTRRSFGPDHPRRLLQFHEGGVTATLIATVSVRSRRWRSRAHLQGQGGGRHNHLRPTVMLRSGRREPVVVFVATLIRSASSLG